MEPGSAKSEADYYTAEAYNNYLHTQVIVRLTGELSKGKVLNRKLDRDGNPTYIRN